MPLQAEHRNVTNVGSWVEHWLERYCPPGAHEFVGLTRRTRACVRCRKQLIVAHPTCLVCEIPGEVPAALERIDAPGHPQEGTLCGLCMDEFERRVLIRGWLVVDADLSS